MLSETEHLFSVELENKNDLLLEPEMQSSKYDEQIITLQQTNDAFVTDSPLEQVMVVQEQELESVYIEDHVECTIELTDSTKVEYEAITPAADPMKDIIEDGEIAERMRNISIAEPEPIVNELCSIAENSPVMNTLIDGNDSDSDAVAPYLELCAPQFSQGRFSFDASHVDVPSASGKNRKPSPMTKMNTAPLKKLSFLIHQNIQEGNFQSAVESVTDHSASGTALLSLVDHSEVARGRNEPTSFDDARRKAIAMADSLSFKRGELEREQRMRLEKKQQEEELVARRGKAPSLGFSSIRAGLTKKEYRDLVRSHGSKATPSSNSSVYSLDSAAVSTADVEQLLRMEPGERHSQQTIPKHHAVKPFRLTVIDPATAHSSGVVADEHFVHQIRADDDTASQQSGVHTVVSDHLIDQRFGWHRNYYSGSKQQKRTAVETGTGSLPPTAIKSPKVVVDVTIPHSRASQILSQIPLIPALMGETEDSSDLNTHLMEPLEALQSSPLISTVASQEAPEFVSQMRLRQQSANLESAAQLIAQDDSADDDHSIADKSLISEMSSSVSSSHHRGGAYRIVKLYMHRTQMAKALNPHFHPGAEEAEKKALLLEQLKRSVYVDPTREVSWRVTDLPNYELKSSTRAVALCANEFEHELNMRTGRLLNAYRPWSTTRKDDFDYDRFQASLREAKAAAVASAAAEAAAKKAASTLAPLNSPGKGRKSAYGSSKKAKQLKGHKSLRRMPTVNSTSSNMSHLDGSTSGNASPQALSRSSSVSSMASLSSATTRGAASVDSSSFLVGGPSPSSRGASRRSNQKRRKLPIIINVVRLAPQAISL